MSTGRRILSAGSLPSRPVLGVVAAVLAVSLAWQAGRLQGGEAASAAVGADGAADADGAGSGATSGPDLAAASPVPAPGAAAGELEARLRRAEDERDAALATVGALERGLARTERLSMEDVAALELYRRMESGSIAAGLGVDVVRLEAYEGVLAITLVQSRGRKRVRGSLGATLLGPDGAVRELVPSEGEGSVPFDLRFFETVRLPLDDALVDVLAEGDAWTDVRIELRPADPRERPIVEIRERDTILK